MLSFALLIIGSQQKDAKSVRACDVPHPLSSPKTNPQEVAYVCTRSKHMLGQNQSPWVCFFWKLQLATCRYLFLSSKWSRANLEDHSANGLLFLILSLLSSHHGSTPLPTSSYSVSWKRLRQKGSGILAQSVVTMNIRWGLFHLTKA